ncbi:MAG: cation:proton antiporter [Thermoproteota archaeon]|nr:cation:proton antiporter [Thermoproteota archaeon]
MITDPIATALVSRNQISLFQLRPLEKKTGLFWNNVLPLDSITFIYICQSENFNVAIEITQIWQDLAVIMVVSSVMALISYKLKQPLILGYIGAGIIIGPHTPPFSLITNIEILNLFAEIGIVLLLFTIGMEFPIQKLKSIGKKAAVITIVEQVGTLIAGFFAGQALGFSLYDSMYLAVALSVSSTVIIMKVLQELNVVREESSYLMLGILIIEDILILSLFALLQSVSITGNISLIEIAIPMGITVGFIIGILTIGSKFIPKVVDYVSKTNQHDVLIVVGLGIAFGFAYISNQIGISVAVGAFFAGVLVAESKSHSVMNILTSPIRDMFVALFFVSVGALMDIKVIPLFIVPALILMGATSAAKFLAVVFFSKFLGFTKKISLQTAIGLSSTRGGEMSLIVAKGGIDIGIASPFILPIVGTITIVSTFLSPYIIKLGWKATGRGRDEAPSTIDEEESQKPA